MTAAHLVEEGLADQRLADEALPSSWQIESLPAIAHTIDANGRLLTVSNRWLEKLGYQRGEVIGRASLEFFTPETQGRLNRHLEPALFENGHQDDVPAQMLSRCGKLIDVLMSSVLERNVDGQPLRGLTVIQDVTDRKKQELDLRQSRELLMRTGEAAGVGGWQIEIASGELHWSAQTYLIHGVSSDYQPTVEEAINFYAPEARPIIKAAVEGSMLDGSVWDLELPFIRADGTRIWVRAVGKAEFENGRPVRLSGAFQDVSAKVQQRQMFEALHQRLSLATEAGGVGTWDYNIVTDRFVWDQTMCRLYGLAQGNEPRNSARWLEHLHVDDRECVKNQILDTLNKGKSFDLEFRIVCADGSQRHLRSAAKCVLGEDGKLSRVVGVNWDVTEQRRLSGEMTHRASHDMLTGLVNRAEFEARLSRLLVSLQTDGGAHTLLYLDLDQFKLVNDACGHGVGDQLLIQISKLLLESMRSTDTVARLGGDEFGVILKHCPSDQAKRVAEQICERMSDFRFSHEDRRFRIGTSIGMVPVDGRWRSSAAVMQAADSACYAAKDAGRNRVHEWFDTDQTMRIRQGDMKWASRLEQALDEDRFVLFGQCIHALNIVPKGLYAEVLVRLRDVDGTMVPPGAFLPAAERFHLASRLDRWVLRHTIKMLRGLPDLNEVATLSVNLSGQSIGDRAFQREANQLFCQAGPEICSRICLEITETAAVTHIADAARFVEQIHDLGVRVSLDDFGSGASSFGYLKKLRVDQIKIDGQFIKDLLDDPLDDAAVRSFVEVARVVGAQTVAEFVDRPEVLARVRQIGIHYAQGFLLHRPEPLAELLAERSVLLC
jgi:diguanylate cyclase